MSNQFRKHVNMRPRLECAAGLIESCDTIADIGCDHGRLSIALLQKGIVKKAVLCDISTSSLDKARRLANIVGLESSIDIRVGDGLDNLDEGEAHAIFLLGMGGMLIRDILERAKTPLMGAKKAVLQPMRSVEELREYLYISGYRIVEDKIVMEKGRYYQVFSIERGIESIPEQWPTDFFALGHKSINEPLFLPFAENLAKSLDNSLFTARGRHGGQKLEEQLQAVKRAILFAKGL